MTEEHITMSHKEVDRLGVIQQVVGKQLKQREAAQQLTAVIDSTETLLDMLEAPAPAPDKAVLADDAFRDMYQANLAESVRQGMTGPAYDMAVIARPWGFEPEAITVSVSVWYGEEDVNTPPAMGRYLADTIPGCRKRMLGGYGHFLAFAHATDILQALAGNC